MGQSYYFERTGNWSGGGLAFLNNAQFAAKRHSFLNGSSKLSVPIIARNTVSPKMWGSKYVLVPQNAWPYSKFQLGDDFRRWAALKGLGYISTNRAQSVIRISGALPPSETASEPIHNVLDSSFEEAYTALNPINKAQNYILVLGSWTKFRNLSFVAQAFKSYIERGGQSHLRIVGSGSHKQVRDTERLFFDIPNVHLDVNWYSKSDCLNLMTKAKVVVFPSRVEASPFSLLEALAVNQNVLASDILGHRELIQKHQGHSESMLFPLSDPSELTSKFFQINSLPKGPITSLLRDYDYRQDQREQWADDIASWLSMIEQ